MPPEPAFYVWKPAGKSVSVHFDLAVIDSLRSAVLKASHSEEERRDEVGGLLLGRVGPDQNIIVDGFELLSSEHRRGASFILSSRDGEKLGTRLQWWVKHHNEREPIGFFRSHTRPGLYLDRNDQEVISRFFPKPTDIALLVRPAEDGACTAGFFFWEDVAVQGTQSYLEFPLDARRLAPQSYVQGSSPQPETKPLAVLAQPRNTRWRVGAAGLALLLLPLLFLYAYRSTSTNPQASTVQSQPRALASQALAKVSDEAVLGGPASAAANHGSDVSGDVNADDSIDGLPVIDERVKLSPRADRRDSPEPEASRSSSTAHAPLSLSAVARGPLETDARRSTPFIPAPPPLEGKSPVHLAVAPPLVSNPRMTAVGAPATTVALEPVNESMVRRAVNHVPLVSALQRHRFRAGERFTPARPVRDIATTVPRELRSKLSGAPIDLKITVDKTGSVAETELLSKKADSALAELAVRTVSQWEFIPARINSRAVTSEMLVHMRVGERTQP